MGDRKEFVVYLSSTLADLKPEREVAVEAIRGVAVVKDSYRADEKGAVAACTGDVRKCHLYVGILGQRYGYVPPQEEENPNNRSITELEYEACLGPDQTAIPRLMFIKTAVSLDHIDALNRKETAVRMEEFLTRARSEQMPYEFDNLEKLRSELRIRVEKAADVFHGTKPVTEPVTVKKFRWPDRLDFATYRKKKAEGFVGRDWLFERLDKWAEHGTKPFLLLGDFGVGKTAAIARLLERWKDRLLVEHFCRYNDDETLKPGRIVGNIATQLRDLIPAYRTLIEEDSRLQAWLAEAEDEPARALKHAVIAPLVKIGNDRPSGDCFLIIDALDESLEIQFAPSSDRSSRAITLTDLLMDPSIELPEWMHLLISSRGGVGIVKSATVRNNFETLDFKKDEEALDLKDIAGYIEQRAVREEPIGEFLQRADRTVDDLARALTLRENGRFFLLVKSVLNEIANDNMGALTFDNLPTRMDEFYEQSFKWRIGRAGLDVGRVRSLLGLIAIAREPIPRETLAAIIGVQLKEVDRIFEGFAGLLVPGNKESIIFAHFSLENWLLGKYEPGYWSAEAYRIDPEEASRTLLAFCQVMVHKDLNETGGFKSYLDRAGVSLLVERKDFASALELLSSLRAQRRRPLSDPNGEQAIGAQQLRLQSNLILERLDARWRDFEEGGDADRKRIRTAFSEIRAPHLRDLLVGKDYETGKYVPVIRILIECHSDKWPEIMDELLADPKENDIVFRHDCGVAYAKAWHVGTGEEKENLFRKIEEMARDQDSPDHREIAAYALKYICERVDKTSWWGGSIKPKIKTLAELYAHSENATDRMVAGEMLLALAIQGEMVTEWFPDRPGQVPFWDPYWCNHRADIDSIRTVLGVAGPGSARPREAKSLAKCQAQHSLAVEIGMRLSGSEFFRRGGPGGNLARLLKSLAVQQDETDAFDAGSVNALAVALKGPFKRDILDFVRLLMLHPLWNVTERGATLLSELIRREPALLPVIDELANLDSCPWRIRYGIVDVSYDYGCYDNYATFFKWLIKCGRDTSCRVRGISIDDLNGWIRDADDATLEEKLGDGEVVGVIRHWLETADDIWLLEYLHEMFSDLSNVRNLPRTKIAEIMGLPDTTLSHYLGAPTFYYKDAKAFMKEVEDTRRKEWSAPEARATE